MRHERYCPWCSHPRTLPPAHPHLPPPPTATAAPRHLRTCHLRTRTSPPPPSRRRRVFRFGRQNAFEGDRSGTVARAPAPATRRPSLGDDGWCVEVCQARAHRRGVGACGRDVNPAGDPADLVAGALDQHPVGLRPADHPVPVLEHPRLVLVPQHVQRPDDRGSLARNPKTPPSRPMFITPAIRAGSGAVPPESRGSADPHPHICRSYEHEASLTLLFRLNRPR